MTRLIYDYHSKLDSALETEPSFRLKPLVFSHRISFGINRQSSTLGRRLALIYNLKLNYFKFSIRSSFERHLEISKFFSFKKPDEHAIIETHKLLGCPGDKKYISYLGRVSEIVLRTSNDSMALEHRQFRMHYL